MRSVVQISRATEEIPMTVKSADVVISTDVVTLETSVPLEAQCTSVELCFTGAGDVRVRRDGGTPVAGSSGELWVPLGMKTVNREEYNLLKMVRSGSTDGAVHITQMTGGRLS